MGTVLNILSEPPPFAFPLVLRELLAVQIQETIEPCSWVDVGTFSFVWADT